MSKSHAWEMLAKQPKGTTIHTIVRHVAPSGMSRVIDPMLISNGPTFYLRGLADDCDLKIARNHDGFLIRGIGMDMAWKLVYDIGMLIHGDGYYFNQRDL